MIRVSSSTKALSTSESRGIPILFSRQLSPMMEPSVSDPFDMSAPLELRFLGTPTGTMMGQFFF